MSILKRRAELLEELIRSTANLTPGHPRYDALARSCKDQIDFHSFLDTHPDVVNAEYARLKERLEDNAQFDKVTALGILTTHLLNLNLTSSQLDFASRQLSFLLAASRNVLRTAVDPEILAPPQQEGLLGDNKTAALALDPSQWTDDEDDSDAEWWANEVSYSPEDGLSVWSGDEEENEDEKMERTGADDDFYRTEDGGDFLSPTERDGLGGNANDNKTLVPDPTKSPLTPLAVSRTAHRSPTRHSGRGQQRHLSPSQRRVRQPYGATSLSVWLAAKDSGGHPARQLDPRRCFTDNELVIQVINMLKGLQMPGLAFKFDAESDSYRVCRGVHTSNLPPTSTASLLTTFASLATHLRRIQTFCDAVVFTSAACETASKVSQEDSERTDNSKALRALPTVAAFAAAVARQVLAIRGQLVTLETSATSQNTNNSNNNGGLNTINLLSLRLKLAVMNRQVGALHGVVKECYWRGTAPCTAADLLDTLYSVLETHLMRSGQHSGAVSAMLAEIFCATWKPMNDALECWLSTGSLIDAPPEFFIVDLSSSSGTDTAKDENFWSERYRLQRWSEKEEEEEKGEGKTDISSTIAAPALIAPLAESLFHAGLASVGLTLSANLSTSSMEQQHEEASLSLHTEFVQSLIAIIREHENTDKKKTNLSAAATSTDKGASPLCVEKTLNSKNNISSSLDSGICIKEWTAAVSRSPTTALVPLAEDISDLSLFPLTAADLPAAFMCPESTALAARDGTDTGDNIISNEIYRNDTRVSINGIESEEIGEEGKKNKRHPVAVAMHLASSARAQQAAAGKLDSVIVAAEFTATSDSVFSNQKKEEAMFRFGGRGKAVRQSTFTGTTKFSEPTTMTTISEEKKKIPFDAASWSVSPPLQVLTDISLVISIKKRMQKAEKRACEAVLQAGLLSQLNTLETVAAAAGRVLAPFVQYVLRNSSTSRGVDGLSPFELNAALANALVGNGNGLQGGKKIDETLPGLASLTVAISPTTRTTTPTTINTFTSGLSCSVSSLNRVVLTLTPSFPLNLIATDSFLRLHTTLWTLSLQLQWVAQSLIAARVALWKENQNNSNISTSDNSTNFCTNMTPSATRAAQQEMLHLVHAVRQHMLTHLESTGVRMRRGIATCTSLREMEHQCRVYEDELRQGCFLGGLTTTSISAVHHTTATDSSDCDPPTSTSNNSSAPELHSSLLEILESSLRHCILLGHARQASAAVNKAKQAQLDADDAEEEALALDTLELAEQRLPQVYSALQATEREFENHRIVFMQQVSKNGSEAGAHSDAARALLAAVDVEGRWKPKEGATHAVDEIEGGREA